MLPLPFQKSLMETQIPATTAAPPPPAVEVETTTDNA